ncbi:MAG: porphobilinogen synthase [Mariprofundaceae bacterium]|nr:porphobilinogen synthase [Mariprofundaceae bacterium]
MTESFDMPIRPRRLRHTATLRAMVSETTLSVSDLIYPLFIDETVQVKTEVTSMPGVYRIPVSLAAEAAQEVADLGIKGVILFGIPLHKDDCGSAGWDDDAVVQQAIRSIKAQTPDLCVIADTCFCEYTDHGHCGVLKGEHVDNDVTLKNLQKEALSYARAGVDVIAPSGMMDGTVEALRSALDQNGWQHIPIMSYAVKYASAYYGPFRDAADCSPQFGDRASYQMDSGNIREAIREAQLDVTQGADILMVKPGLAYMDVIRAVKEVTDVPMAVYNVSGEYAMVKAAAEKGWIDERRVVLETMLSFKRAGADLILTYHALDVAKWLNDA